MDKDVQDILRDAIELLHDGFGNLPDHDQTINPEIEKILGEVALRMHDNFPYQHPLYAGQMLKPPHPVAHLAYFLAMYINPNNHAFDGGRASSRMEKECVRDIAKMFGWDTLLGHLTSGGTMANMEALWISRELNPGKKVVASSQAHYTHSRISSVLKIDFDSIPVDKLGKMDLIILEERIKSGDIGTVVTTLGTTGLGTVDPLHEIIELKKKYNFRIHVDAAYGGYFTLVDNLAPDTRKAFDCLEKVDSIVIDPHKHGLQPYGCGCVLFRDQSVGSIYKHDSPYTYFSSDDLHLGEISLECSRAGASAVALWATMKMFPLEKNGEFANDLKKCRSAAIELFRRLQEDNRFLTAFPPELDIVIWTPNASKVSESSKLARECFNKAADANLHLAMANLSSDLFKSYWHNVDFDQSTVTCLRSCLMKPEHFDWIDEIWKIIDTVASE